MEAIYNNILPKNKLLFEVRNNFKQLVIVRSMRLLNNVRHYGMFGVEVML